MRPKRFVEAVRRLEWTEVLDDQDVRRVHLLCAKAAENSADRVLVGFRVRGPVVLIVWAVIEVIRLGPLEGKDLAPGLPPDAESYEGWDFRLGGLTFAEGQTAELADVDEAKPPQLKDSPAILVSYPGRVSWKKLQRVTEQLFDS